MLTGTVAEVGPDATLDLAVGDQVTTLVSLTLTPLVITDDLADWDGLSEQVPCQGHAILFAQAAHERAAGADQRGEPRPRHAVARVHGEDQIERELPTSIRATVCATP